MTRKKIIAHLKGIFPPVVTPFNRRGDVDEGRFRVNLEQYLQAGMAGIVVAGSTGEAPYLTERERLRLTELARQVVAPPQLLIVGAGLESTRETLRLSREAEARGADALLIIPPNYYKSRMDSAVLLPHFRAIAGGLRRPVIIYSIPQFTGIRIDTETIAKLSRHPNIVGIKESSGDLAFLKSIVRRTKTGFRVLTGSGLILLEAFRAGAAGAVLGPSGFVPELCLGVYEAFRQGNMKTARDLQQRLATLTQKIAGAYGVPGIKAALDLCGYAGGAPRSPLLPLDGTGRRVVAKAIQEAHSGLES